MNVEEKDDKFVKVNDSESAATEVAVVKKEEEDFSDLRIGSLQKRLLKFSILPTVGAFFMPFPGIVNTMVLGRFKDPTYLAAYGLG